MRRLIFGLYLALVPVLGLTSAGGGVHLDEANIDLTNKASLQRGAKYFVNYCLGCHSAKYMRYNRLAQDLELSESMVTDNLMFTGQKIGNTMSIAMKPADAASWFGTQPPDLSLIARSRSVDWLYTYLRGFYLDESRPYGVNNIVFPDVGMPHVMWDLQGLQKAVFKPQSDEHGGAAKEVFEGFELVESGELDPAGFDGVVRDLVAFLAYTSEPVQLQRQGIGFWVLMFLAGFFVIAYFLKKEYWKDIH